MSTEQFQPLIEELRPAPDVEEVFRKFSGRPHCLFLDSAQRHPELGRYSFVAADPFEWLEIPAVGSGHEGRRDGSGATGPHAEREEYMGKAVAGGLAGPGALHALAGRLAGRVAATVPGLPPFQGGAAGVFGYEMGRQLETVPSARFDEFRFPWLAVGLYDVVVALDHAEDRAWIISQGLPETEPDARLRRARSRMSEFLGDGSPHRNRLAISHGESKSGDARPHSKGRAASGEDLAPQYRVAGPEGLTSDFSEEGYFRAVERVIEYIRAGDVFQVNLSQRLLYPAADDPVSLYLRLRRRNPAPFAGYLDLGGFQVASASPERFLRVCGDQVETRPIKGTRRRAAQPDAGRAMRDELQRSEKDRAENVMIVDLLRNDLSRVCRPESVLVSQLCEVESYEYVEHLVSAVRGKLRAGRGPLDLIAAAFPGGSITGAPKVRAMEIIAELEPTARGAYCGSLGYISFDGSMDLNILIRTITAGRGWWQLPVGGGIVVQSDPRLEYEETWHKAEGMLRALE